MSPLYILASSCISPQHSFLCDDLIMDIQCSENNMLYCIEPDFKQYINPVQIRRMSRALKIGYTAAISCLNQQPDSMPEAVLIGTGKGCLEDTEHFLHSIKEYNETALNATHFIHSTYNQLNGMIALNKKISSYNMTYVHRGFSFEHSLMDAALLFAEGDTETALVGSFDEMTLEHFTVKKQWGYWKKESIRSLDLLSSRTEGTISGEGSAFYLVSRQKPQQPVATIKHISPLYRPSNADVTKALEELLDIHSLKKEDIDFVLSGKNGDANIDASYQHVDQLFDKTQKLYFKHLCGEYDTATSFACWLASKILTTQVVPDYLYSTTETQQTRPANVRHILLYNNYFDLNQSLMLLSLEA